MVCLLVDNKMILYADNVFPHESLIWFLASVNPLVVCKIFCLKKIIQYVSSYESYDFICVWKLCDINYINMASSQYVPLEEHYKSLLLWKFGIDMAFHQCVLNRWITRSQQIEEQYLTHIALICNCLYQHLFHNQTIYICHNGLIEVVCLLNASF